jgi:hypothetical protein
MNFAWLPISHISGKVEYQLINTACIISVEPAKVGNDYVVDGSMLTLMPDRRTLFVDLEMNAMRQLLLGDNVRSVPGRGGSSS